MTITQTLNVPGLKLWNCSDGQRSVGHIALRSSYHESVTVGECQAGYSVVVYAPYQCSGDGFSNLSQCQAVVESYVSQAGDIKALTLTAQPLDSLHP